VLVALGGARRPGTDTVPILVGVALLEVGIIVATPTILLVVAGLGRHLPFGPRLALRDAGRNRSSAAPAVAAIMAAVIGCTAVLLGVAAENAQQRRTYQPQALRGEVSFLVGSLDGGSAQVATAVSAAMRATLPARTVVVVSDPGRSCPGSSNHCTVPAPEVTPVVPAGTVRTTRYANGSGGQAVVAGPGALEALTGVDAPTAEAALRAGHAVVADGWAVHDGVAALQVERYLASGPKTTTVDVPAVALTRGFAAAQVILPPSLAARIGVGSNPVTVLAATTRMPTSAELQALQAALDRVEATFPAAVGGLRPVARVERGWQDHDGTRMVLLLLAAAVVAVAAAGIATGLTNAERATDMGVVEAVGGSRRTLRLVSVSRAGVIAGIGVVLGTAAGFVPALAFILSRNRGLGGAGAVGAAPGGAGVLLTPSPSYALHLTVPWLAMTVLVVGIPLVAAGLAGLLSRPSVVTGRRRVGPA
jgi:putative ABC transport system permease protein